jgi:hypothetical protein
MNAKTAKKKPNAKPNPTRKEPTLDKVLADLDKGVAKMTRESERRALLWWGWSQGALLSISRAAMQLAKEVERPGSRLAGLFDAKELRGFASRLPDLSTDLSNAIESVVIPLPLADHAEDQ